MKEIFVYILLVAISMLLSYLTLAFVLNDFSTSNWDAEGRFYMLFIGAIYSIASVGIYYTSKQK